MKKLLLLSFVVFVLASCHKKEEPVQSEGFVLPAVSGENWDFKAQNKTKPVFIAFMATYCGYCKRMTPYIDELAQKYSDKGIEVVIALVDDDAAAAADFAKTQNVKHAKVVYDAGDLAMTVSVRAFPQMFLFDDKTNSIGTWSGFNPDYVESISQQLDGYLARPAAPSSTMPREQA
jgi:thioredoxin 1